MSLDPQHGPNLRGGERFASLLGSPQAGGLLWTGIVAVYALRALSEDLWDDALFFQRFGRNIVEHGVAAWNIADGPVHGNTSQLFQGVAAAIVFIFPDHYHVGIKLFLALCALGTFAALSLAHRTLSDDDGIGARAVLICTLSAPPVLLLVSSGMETLLALLVLALVLLLLARLSQRPSPVEVASVAAIQVLVYLVRPDMALLSSVVSAVVLYEPGVGLVGQRRLALFSCLTMGLVGLTLLGLRIYYETAFPLSFYLKNRLLTPYDADYQQLGVPGERRQLATWLLTMAPALFVASFGRSRQSAGLLAGALLFVGYHLSTIGVMGYHCRFFQPATVPVALAAALAWPSFVKQAAVVRLLPVLLAWPILALVAYRMQLVEQRGLDFYLSWIDVGLWLAYGASMMMLFISTLAARSLLTALVPVVAALLLLFALPPRPPVLADSASLAHIREQMRAMRGIEIVAACMDEPLHLYHSELGVPGVMFPNSRITDLSGLMNPERTFSQPLVDDDCLADPPDVLFLPHRTHERLNREIAASRCLTLFARPTGIGRSSSPLYIRRDRLEAFEACHARLVPAQ